MIIYMPSKEMMFKMMRACIGVTDKNDLWIYQSSKLQKSKSIGSLPKYKKK